MLEVMSVQLGTKQRETVVETLEKGKPETYLNGLQFTLLPMTIGFLLGHTTYINICSSKELKML